MSATVSNDIRQYIGELRMVAGTMIPARRVMERLERIMGIANQTEVFVLPDHYDRRANPRLVPVRRMTVAEAHQLRAGQTVLIQTNRNTVGNVKVTSVKTWVTRPGDVRVRVQWGLYENATLIQDGEFVERLLVAVE